MQEQCADTNAMLETNETLILTSEWRFRASEAAMHRSMQAHEHPLALMDEATGFDRAEVYRNLYCVIKSAGNPVALRKCQGHRQCVKNCVSNIKAAPQTGIGYRV